MGVDPSTINPKHIAIYTSPGGMLPQANDSDSDYATQEIPVKVVGEDDEIFHENDYLLFYAEGPGKVLPDKFLKDIRFETNLYDTANYCFLKFGNVPGKRMKSKIPVESPGELITTYDDFIHHESELRNINFSGRHWYGEDLAAPDDSNQDGKLELVFEQHNNPITPNTKIKLFTSALNTGSTEARLKYTVNNADAGILKIKGINTYAYGNQGEAKVGYFELKSDQPEATGPINIKIENINFSAAGLYLDYLTMQFQRDLKFEGKPFLFRSFKSIEHTRVTYAFEKDVAMEVWDVTDLYDIQIQPHSPFSNDSASFSSIPTHLETYAVFNPGQLPAPTYIGEVTSFDLSTLGAPEFLIITHKSLKPEAERLASFRQENDGLRSEVVSTHEIFNVYASGRQDVTAIRNFIRDHYKKGQLKYILLFGDASYDYKNILSEDNTNLVPTYQSRNSIHNIHSFASDDYFTFMESNEGVWKEKGANIDDHTMDLGIGRIPVITVAEAKAVVDKLIHYSTHQDVIGAWRNKLAFFADDGDNNIHQYQSDYLADMVEDSFPRFLPDRIFMDRYPKEDIGHGRQSSPQMRDILHNKVNNGALIIDFIGHGAETAWTNEFILSTSMFEDWNNLDNLPLFLTATCEFGRFDDWRRRSGAELLVLQPTGGAIGMLTTTRPVFFNTNFQLGISFYKSVFKQEGGTWQRLGDVFKSTKNGAVEGVVNRNFSLLGDPSMKLAYPEDNVSIDDMQATSLIETEEEDLLEVTFKGKIDDGTNIQSEFSGTLNYELFDAKSQITTLGNEGTETAFTFDNRENILQKGKTIIESGQFYFSLLIPRSFTDSISLGKLHLYAVNEEQTWDASGGLIDFSIEDVDIISLSDSIGPEISFILGQHQLQDRAKLFSQNTLRVTLKDDAGIKLFEKDTIGLITGTLDGTMRTQMDLSESYEPDIDGPGGYVDIPLEEFRNGHYTLEISATDRAGNVNQATFSFQIISEAQVLVYPNPSDRDVHFRFTLPDFTSTYELTFSIYNIDGSRHGQLTKSLQASGDVLNPDITINRYDDGINPLTAGMYIYNLQILADSIGYSSVHTGKIVIRD